MLVKSLEKMEEIVSSKNFLSWDGWDVLHNFISDKARFSKDGVLKNGKWYLQKRYPITENGWDIPNKLMGSKDKSESK